METQNKITTDPIQNAGERNIQEFQNNRNKRKWKNYNRNRCTWKSTYKLNRFIKNSTSTNKTNDHMNTIQSEIDIIHRKFKLIMSNKLDKFRIKEMQQELTNKIRSISIENN